MRADGRFGGHIVQGHVDGTGEFLALDRVQGADDYWLRIEIPAGPGALCDLQGFIVH